MDSIIQPLNNWGLHFHVVLFIALYKVALSFKSVYETIVCDQRLLSSTSMNWAVYFSAQGADLLPVVDPMQNLFAQTIHLYQSGFDRSLYFELQTNQNQLMWLLHQTDQAKRENKIKHLKSN